MQTYQKTYSTSDLYLATALKLHNFKLLTFENLGAGKGEFIFEDRDDRQEFVRRYFSGELQGSLKEFASEWRNLKRMIFEVGNQRGK